MLHNAHMALRHSKSDWYGTMPLVHLTLMLRDCDTQQAKLVRSDVAAALFAGAQRVTDCICRRVYCSDMCGFGTQRIRTDSSIEPVEQSRVRQGLGQGPLLSSGCHMAACLFDMC